MSDKFKQILLSMISEFESSQGFVTCEVAIHKDKVKDFEEFIKNIPTFHGKWVLMTCKTCEEYHGENHRHLSLEKNNVLDSFKAQPEFIQMFNDEISEAIEAL